MINNSKRILVIIGNYSPDPSSVANCAEPLIKKLISRGYKIDVVTNRKRVDILEFECINDINIYRVDDYHVMNTVILNNLTKINSSKILKFITHIAVNILKVCYYIRYCLFDNEPGTGGWELKRVVSKCIDLHNEHKYNAVITFSLPFKSNYIAKQFLQEISDPVKWIMYEYDPFSYNAERRISKRKRVSRIKDEHNMFNACDKVLLTPELNRFYSKTVFSDYADKFISIPYANMNPLQFNNDNNSSTDIEFESNKIHCLFTGRLYKDIRNPNYAIKIFSLLKENIHLTLLTNFSADTILENVVDSKDGFSVLPFQPRDTVIRAYKKADILVNIGNTVELQVPGKIFEYMSTGKPIIHFSKFEEDPAIFYFNKYPCVLIIKEWEDSLEEQALQIEKFCMENAGYSMEYSEVYEALNEFDGENVSDKFVDIISTLLNKG